VVDDAARPKFHKFVIFMHYGLTVIRRLLSAMLRHKPASSPMGATAMQSFVFLWIGVWGVVSGAGAYAQTDPSTSDNPAQVAVIRKLRFSDFFKLPIGPRGPEMGAQLLQAQGQTVQVTGYMVQQERPLPGEFLLTPRPVQMSEHADGEADDLPVATMRVLLDPSQADRLVPHQRGLVQLQGVLSAQRQVGPDGRVSWVQLQLTADAARAMDLTELARYVHAKQHTH
jgi:hypothetical protein